MANGKAHDRFNLLALVIILIASFAIKIELSFTLSFILGFLFSTYVFGPDSDLGPKKRIGLFGTFLYPYRLFFKHRGLSHHFLIGTLSRVIYLGIILGLGVWMIKQMGGLEKLISMQKMILSRYDQSWPIKLSAAFLLGQFCSDLSHLFLDKLSDLLKRLNPF